MDHILNCLEKRGFVEQITSKELTKVLSKPVKFYIGFDPTADSLHIGHLVGIIAIKWLQRFGHHGVVLLGGATARIGDPSGKSVERPFLEDRIIERNVESIRGFFQKLFGPQILILNNNDWFAGIRFIDFLRDIGKHFRMGPMLSKESVRTRMETEEGLSYTEFSYQMLQAYDFFYLSQHHGIVLQTGGSDQWGNITAGIELARKLSSQSLYGMTFPLLTRSDGRKFGKTESGTVWLSEDRMSPYHFYQYLISIPDADVIRMLSLLTFLDFEEIEEIEKEMKTSSYVPNSAQKRLAEEVTRFVHGEEGLQKALKITKGVAPGKQAILDIATLDEIAKEMPHKIVNRQSVVGKRLVDVMVMTQLTSSKSAAVRLIQQGGVYLNNERMKDPTFILEENHFTDHRFLLLSIGKKKRILIEIINSSL